MLTWKGLKYLVGKIKMKNLHIKRMETFKCSLKVICLFTPKIPHKEEFEYLKKTKHQHSDGNAHNAIVRYVM